MLFCLLFIYLLLNLSITSFLFYVHFIKWYNGTKTVCTELKQCIKFTHTCEKSTFNSWVLRNYTRNSMPCLATRSNVDCSIPIIEKKLHSWGSKLWLFNHGHCNVTPRPRRYCWAAYLYWLHKQYDCSTNMRDLRRLSAIALSLRSYSIDNIFLHKGRGYCTHAI